MTLGASELLLLLLVVLTIIGGSSLLRSFGNLISKMLNFYWAVKIEIAQTQAEILDEIKGMEKENLLDNDPYKILGVSPNDSEKQITIAYRALAQKYHPDKVAGLAPEYREIGEAKMKAINLAYAKLRGNFTQTTNDS